MPERSLPPWADPSVHAALWAATATAAAVVATIPGLAAVVRAELLFQFAVTPGSLSEAVSIAVTNARVVGGVLVATWLVRRCPALRPGLDFWVVATLSLNALAVGSAVGAYGPRAIVWLAHLPLEWTALGSVASFYSAARRCRLRLDARSTVAISVAVLAGAAVIESYAAPS